MVKKLVQELKGFKTVDAGDAGCRGCAFRPTKKKTVRLAMCASVACLVSQRKDARNVHFVVLPDNG